MRRLRTWMKRFAIALIVAAIALTGIISTHVGQSALLRLIAWSASDASGGGIRFGQLDGSLFSKGRLSEIALRDGDGAWLVARDVAFAWSPTRLLRGEVAIREIEIARIEVVRRPNGAPAATAGGDATIAMPSFLPFEIARIGVAEIALGQALLGAPARLRATGSARLVDVARGLDFDLSIERTDTASASLTAALHYRPADRKLSIGIHGEEAAGGLLASLIGLPDSAPVSLQMDGAGALDAWRATWSMASGPTPFVAGTLAIDREADAHAILARMDGYLQAITPQRWRDLVRGRTVADIAIRLPGAGRVLLDRANIANDTTAIEAAGIYDSRRRDMSGAAELRLAGKHDAPVTLPLGASGALRIASLDARLDVPDVAQPTPATLTATAEHVESPQHGKVTRIDLTASATRTAGKALFAADRLKVSLKADAQGLAPSEVDPAAPAGLRAQITADGAIDAHGFDGAAIAHIDDIAVLVRRAGIDAAGPAELSSQGRIAYDASAFDLAIKGGGARSTSAGSDARAPMRFAAHAQRKGSGTISIEAVDIAADWLRASGRAQLSDTQIDITARADVADLARLSPIASGRAHIAFNARGPLSALHSRLDITSPALSNSGRDVKDLQLAFTGAGPLDAHAGTARLGALALGRPLAASANVALSRDALSLDALRLDWGGMSARGNARLAAQSPTARIELKHEDLSQLSALAGMPIGGTADLVVEIVQAEADAAASGTAQEIAAGHPRAIVRLKGTAPHLRIAEARAVRTALDMQAPLAPAVFAPAGTLRIDTLTHGNAKVRDLDITLMPRDKAARITTAAIANDMRITLAADLMPREDGADIAIADLRAARDETLIALAEPSTIAIRNEAATVKRLTLRAGEGRVELDGTASRRALDLTTRMSRLPASIAALVDPALDMAGTITGTARAQGSPAAPVAEFDATWQQARAPSLERSGLPALDIKASGRLDGTGLITRLNATGQGDLTLAAQIQMTGPALDRIAGTIEGRVPLQLANAMLAERGTRLTGTASITGELSGTTTAPKLDSRLAIENAGVRDPGSGLAIRDMTGRGRISERALTIEDLRGTGLRGGTLEARGDIVFAQAPARFDRLAISLAHLHIDDGELAAGEIDGTITLDGPLTAARAQGRIDVKRLDVTVPDRLPRSISALDLKHVNAPPTIAARQDRARIAGESGGDTDIELDVAVHAPDRIAVRGRGLDALLGGDLRLRGSASAPVAVGGFHLVRGRLSLLGRQLDFKRGTVAFAGSLEPNLDLEAEAEADGVTIKVLVTGPASRPVFRLTSQPDLPEDEILARLVFNKALVKLSPLQIAQLAGEIDKLGGLSRGPGVLDQLKGSLGIDRLDVVTEKDGSTAVSAGSYVGDNTYVGVRQGLGAKQSRIVIDHDLTKSIKARGEVGSDGSSKLGIGVEWDY